MAFDQDLVNIVGLKQKVFLASDKKTDVLKGGL